MKAQVKTKNKIWTIHLYTRKFKNHEFKEIRIHDNVQNYKRIDKITSQKETSINLLKGIPQAVKTKAIKMLNNEIISFDNK